MAAQATPALQCSYTPFLYLVFTSFDNTAVHERLYCRVPHKNGIQCHFPLDFLQPTGRINFVLQSNVKWLKYSPPKAGMWKQNEYKADCLALFLNNKWSLKCNLSFHLCYVKFSLKAFFWSVLGCLVLLNVWYECKLLKQ